MENMNQVPMLGYELCWVHFKSVRQLVHRVHSTAVHSLEQRDYTWGIVTVFWKNTDDSTTHKLHTSFVVRFVLKLSAVIWL